MLINIVMQFQILLIEGTEKFVEEVTCTVFEDLASNELVELPFNFISIGNSIY